MEWIYMGTQLPTIGQRVITYFEHTGIDIGTYYKSEEVADMQFDCFEFEDGWLCDDVTHWMPLPLPPPPPA